MIAPDTNVVVRLLTGDDPAQLEAAREAFQDSDEIWLATSVLLETEWVLRYCYQLGREVTVDTLTKLLGYRRLRCQDRKAALAALAGYRHGLDFADALHLASSAPADRFVTFDRKMARRAERLRARPPVSLLGGKAPKAGKSG